MAPNISHHDDIIQARTYEDWEGIVIMVVMVSLSLAATFGNVMVFIAYAKDKMLRRATNYFIISLATADIIVATFVVNVHTMYMVIGWPFEVLSYQVCLLWLSVDYWVFQVSIFGILLVTGDRYFSIKYPIRYRVIRTDKRVRQSIGMNWIVSFIIWVPIIIVFGSNDVTKHDLIARKSCDVGSAKIVPYTIIGSCVSYVLPIIISLVFVIDSARILFNLNTISAKRKKTITNGITLANPYIAPERPADMKRITFVNLDSLQDKNGESVSVSEQSSDIENIGISECDIVLRNNDVNMNNGGGRRHATIVNPIDCYRKTSKDGKRKQSISNAKVRRQSFVQSISDYQWMATFNILLGVSFVVNILPFGVLAITRSFCSDCVSQKIWYFGYIMCYLNSMLNPICYALGNKNFKQAFKEILCR